MEWHGACQVKIPCRATLSARGLNCLDCSKVPSLRARTRCRIGLARPTTAAGALPSGLVVLKAVLELGSWCRQGH
jgi:hypothetical protein